jgi:hypothetical protein
MAYHLKVQNLPESDWTGWQMLRLPVVQFEGKSLNRVQTVWPLLIAALVLDFGDFDSLISCKAMIFDTFLLELFHLSLFWGLWTVSHIPEINANALKISNLSIWACSGKQFLLEVYTAGSPLIKEKIAQRVAMPLTGGGDPSLAPN